MLIVTRVITENNTHVTRVITENNAHVTVVRQQYHVMLVGQFR